MTVRRLVPLVVLLGALLVAGAVPARAQASSLAGGGSLNGQVVEIPVGGTLGPIYSVYLQNKTDASVDAAFFQEAPPGVDVTPDRAMVTVAPGETARVYYSVAVTDAVAAGDYQIKTGLTPTNVEPEPGRVTFVPAFATQFPLRVVGASGQIVVRAHDLARGVPADGQISIARLDGDKRLVIAQADGSELSAKVAPGEYEARFDLGGRTLGSRRVTVAAEQVAGVDIDVETVTFDNVVLTRADRDGTLQTVEVAGAINNDLGEIPRAESRLLVERDGVELDSVLIATYSPLAEGAQAVSIRYVPEAGWADGDYRFSLQLLGQDLAVTSKEDLTLTVGAVVGPVDDQALPEGIEPWMLAAGGAALLLLVVLVVLIRRRRRVRRAAAAAVPVRGAPSASKPATAARPGSRRARRAGAVAPVQPTSPTPPEFMAEPQIVAAPVEPAASPPTDLAPVATPAQPAAEPLAVAAEAAPPSGSAMTASHAPQWADPPPGAAPPPAPTPTPASVAAAPPNADPVPDARPLWAQSDGERPWARPRV